MTPERLLSVIEVQNAIAAAGMNADEVMGIVVERASALTSATGAVVAIVEGDEVVYRAVSRPSTIALGTRLSKSASLPGRCVAERAAIKIDDAAGDSRIDVDTRSRLGAGSLLCVPLLYGESAVGVLEVVSVRPSAFTDDDTETLRLLAQIIAIALHRAYTYPRPRYDVATDALTNLGNKRAFDERIQAELTRNRRYGHSFSLAVIDLEGVESAIDRFGQAAGDEALREVASILQKHTRVIDAGFRIAADDFAIVMPGTSREGALVVAERCRAHIRDAKLCDGSVTARVGVVEAADETADDLAGRAAAAVSADKAAQR
ncbi:MAG: sensor domain-containing diguanylate cyclase [Kofleriaceae bacterium]